MNTTSKYSGLVPVTPGFNVNTGKAILTGCVIHAAAADVVVVVYDNTTATGDVIFRYTLDISVEGLSTVVSIPDVKANTGLTIVLSGTGGTALLYYK